MLGLLAWTTTSLTAALFVLLAFRVLFQERTEDGLLLTPLGWFLLIAGQGLTLTFWAGYIVAGEADLNAFLAVAIPLTLAFATVIARELAQLFIYVQRVEHKTKIAVTLLHRVGDLELYIKLLEYHARSIGVATVPDPVRQALDASGHHVPARLEEEVPDEPDAPAPLGDDDPTETDLHAAGAGTQDSGPVDIEDTDTPTENKLA